jgi:hypothetical protein
MHHTQEEPQAQGDLSESNSHSSAWSWLAVYS